MCVSPFEGSRRDPYLMTLMALVFVCMCVPVYVPDCAHVKVT